MAQVTLQVVVQDQQIQQLQQRINQLSNTQITISVNSNDLRTMNTRLNTAATRTQTLNREQQNLQNALRQSSEEFRQETEQINQNSESLNRNRQQNQRRQQQQRQQRQDHQQHNEQLRQEGILYDILGRSVGQFIARMTAYRAVYAGIRAITNGFTEALQTLKAVDDELVTVRKVTGFDPAQMAQVESQAYAVASRYGASASDYVAGVAEFARAGYKELSGDLAELAQKTQIVGDTTAEVANQFLLSVDAAYKYNGSVEQLTRVLDGANEIDNKYATSIQKIAEGMGIVAPVAAQMHVGIDELAASIGTITAVTQRSGSETARALRALFLNIVGDTKTEIEEGVTWTTGEIAGLRDVIKEYARDAYDAAQATGSIIDPMRAMEGLSKSLKDGILTEQQLMEMVSDIGGKLRTSQLLALINNWDMYESMLEDYRQAYGSADKEIENAMDSWTRKTNVLKNTWTEFVKTGLDSSFFKGALDFITGIVEGLDSLPAVLGRILMIVAAFNLPNIVNHISNLVTSFRELGTGLTATSAIISGVAIAWGALSFAVQKYTQAVDEQIRADRKVIEQSAASISQSQERMKTLEQLRTKYAEAALSAESEADKDKILTELKKDLVNVYGLEEEAISKVNDLRRDGLRLLDEENQKELERALASGAAGYNEAARRQRNASTQSSFLIDYTDVERAQEYEKIISAIIEDFETSYRGYDKSARGRDEAAILLSGDIQKRIDDLTKIINSLQAKGSMSAAEKTVFSAAAKELERLNKIISETQPTIDGYNELLARSELYHRDFGKAIIETADDLQNYKEWLRQTYEGDEAILKIMLRLVDEAFPSFTESVEDSTDAINLETKALFSNQDALEDNADSTKRLEAAKADAEAAARKLIPVLFDEKGELTEAGKAALEASDYLADLVYEELTLQQQIDQANYANIRAQLAAVSTEALKTAKALVAPLIAAMNLRQVFSSLPGRTSGSGLGRFIDIPAMNMPRLDGDMAQVAQLLVQLDNLESSINSTSVRLGSVSGYTSGRSGSGSSGHSGSSHSSGSGHSSASSGSSKPAEDPRLVEFRQRIELLRSEISLLQARGATEEEQIPVMEQLAQAYRDQADYLTSIGASQVDINNAMTEYYRILSQIDDLRPEEVEDSIPPESERFERRLEILRSRLDLANARGASANERIFLMREILDTTREYAEYLESIGADEVEINRVLAEMYGWHDKIEDVMAEEARLQEEQAQSAREEQEALDRARDAQEALLNAQRQRNVHIYNAATGQWEWVANPGNLRNAQQSYDDALNNLPPAARYYAVTTGRIPSSMGAIPSGGGGTKNYGPTYNIGGINISEADAKAMSVYDLLQLSKSLGIYNRS